MYWVRPLHKADSEAYVRLLPESPDTGRVQFAHHFTLDPLIALHALHPDATVSVAEDEGGQLSDTGIVSFGCVRLHGRQLSSAYLSALAVHPAHRCRGGAGALAAWRFQEARARLGEDGAVYALIQQGNEGSLRTARAWQHALVGRVAVAPVMVRGRPAPTPPGLHVRPAEPWD